VLSCSPERHCVLAGALDDVSRRATLDAEDTLAAAAELPI